MYIKPFTNLALFNEIKTTAKSRLFDVQKKLINV